MSDDKVGLWRAFIDGWVYGEKEQVADYPHGEEGVWRPVADDDAREERLKAAESAAKVCREDAEINATRAEKAEVATKAATRARDEWKARAEKAESTIADAMAIDQGERIERPQPHHPLLSIMAGNRQSLAEFAAANKKELPHV